MSARIIVLLAVVLAIVGPQASAQNYPNRPVRFIVPYPPGGGTDSVARLLTPKLVEFLGEQVVIDNRGGANAIIGSDLAAKAAPDGYTMLFCLQANLAVNPVVYENLPYNPARDFAEVIHLDYVTMLLTVTPSLPVKTIDDLIALAKKKPGELNFSSSGHGSAAHLAGEMIKAAAKIDMVHVPFKGGGPAVTAVVAGQVQFSVGPMISEIGHVKAGRLRAVAVAGTKRTPALPDVPTIGETLAGFDASVWHGVVVPKGVPAAIIRKLNAGFNAALNDPQVRERMHNSGVEPAGGTPEAFAALIRSTRTTYEKLLKQVGMAGSSKL